MPQLAEDGATLSWTAFLANSPTLDFTDIYGVPAHREAYATAWVHHDTGIDLTLAVGADDGVNAWVNTTQVLNISSCQGVVTDAFTAPITLDAGWNRLLFKVRDHGGGWGLRARLLLDGLPYTNLTTSFTDGTWHNDQEDLDGDGTGDVCDAHPADPSAQ